jgi:hypothetical protein
MVTNVTENFGARYVKKADYLNAFYLFRDEPISTEMFRQAALKLDD